jgi:hypothetical protein
MRPRALVVAIVLCATAPASNRAQAVNLPDLLQRQTQELLDAIAAGDRGPWTRYLHEDVVYAAEDGSVKTKRALLDEIRPFPKELWGKLRITRFRTSRHGTTAITNYVGEEDEGYFGQIIHARYLSTDTWIETAVGWKLVASQVLALRDDPPAVRLPTAELNQYVGVYSLTENITYTIRRERDELTGTRTGRKAEPLKIELKDCLFVPGQPRLRKVFQRNAEGRVVGFVERRESWDITWRRRQ